MIRKWSYVNTLSNREKIQFWSKLKKLSKRHSFKVFRRTTRFKKYRLGISRSAPGRKWYTRRKRRTSFYMNSHILHSWIHHYLRHKQFIRFVQSIGLAPISGYLGSADWSVKNSFITGAPYGFNAYSCSFRVLNKRVYFSNKFFQKMIILAHSRNSFIQFFDFEAALNSDNLGTNVIFFDRLGYALNSEYTDDAYFPYIDLIRSLESSVFTSVLELSLEFRKTLIFLSLLNFSKIDLWN
jgi:hypothetical protein